MKMSLQRCLNLALSIYEDTTEVECTDGINWCLLDHDETIYIAIEGSENWEDWKTNLNAFWPKTYGSVTAHRGFMNRSIKVFNDIIAILDETYRLEHHRVINLCGHSLGGALAQIIGQWIQGLYREPMVQVYAFGCPPCFGRGYEINCTIKRFEIDDDPVPKIMNLTPLLRWWFKVLYAQKGFSIRRATAGGLSISEHNMEVYRKAFGRFDELGQ